MIRSKFKSRLLMKIFIVLFLSVFSCDAFCAVENADSEKAQPAHSVSAPSSVSPPQASSVDDEDVIPETWRHICFEMSKDDSSVVRVELLRPLWWIERSGAKVDGVISLTIPELGIAGDAKVLKIGPCTADSRKVVPGSRIVTGKFIHENAKVLDLYFSNSSGEPLGVTPSHPLWSIARNDWVEAGELKIGESVKTKDGIVQLIRRTERSGRHTVYNLEVHKDHTYYVSSLDILVHNGCVPDSGEIAKKLGVSKRVYHKKLKPGMKADFRVEMKKLKTTNPDFGVSDAGTVIVKSPRTGKTIITDVPIEYYKGE